MRYLILAVLTLLSPYAQAEVPDYVGRSLNKTVVVDASRRYTVPGGLGTRYIHLSQHLRAERTAREKKERKADVFCDKTRQRSSHE